MKFDDNHNYNDKYIARIVSAVHLKIMIAAMILLICSPVLLMAENTYFATADDAAKELYNVIVAKNSAAVKVLFGEENIELLPLEDIDEEYTVLFINAWKKSHQVIAGKKDEMFIEVGLEGWTFPIPLIKNTDGWYFDSISGMEIIKTRRIGRNELNTMQAVLAYYDAQKEYSAQDLNGDGFLEFAQKFRSSPGKKDGLYWDVEPGETLSPLGSFFSADTPGGAYHGYYYKILKEQGKNAREGAYNYLKDKRMRLGFALIAWPAEYGDSGVMSFIISQEGVLYETNLGSDTDQIARKITQYNPEKDWLRSEVQP
ncbi:MAG: DUF2950 domain-containing protein [gamma proteobacterium symbiont of Taylorina sp.]|nr:DUF2950 domain-containing protein [gamma proteobacterium symbiont of Taylorina sp.]